MSEKENNYELAYWLDGDLDEGAVKTEEENVKALVSKQNFTISDFILGPKRDLAYDIKHKTNGYLGTIHFHGQGAPINDLKKELDFCKPILRYLIVIVSIQEPVTAKKPIKRISRISKSIETMPMPEEPKIDIDFNDLDKKLEEILKQ